MRKPRKRRPGQTPTRRRQEPPTHSSHCAGIAVDARRLHGKHAERDSGSGGDTHVQEVGGSGNAHDCGNRKYPPPSAARLSHEALAPPCLSGQMTAKQYSEITFVHEMPVTAPATHACTSSAEAPHEMGAWMGGDNEGGAEGPSGAGKLSDMVCRDTGGDTPPCIVWLRQDLRLHDNPALHAAIASGRPVLCLYIYSDDVENDEWQDKATQHDCLV